MIVIRHHTREFYFLVVFMPLQILKVSKTKFPKQILVLFRDKIFHESQKNSKSRDRKRDQDQEFEYILTISGQVGKLCLSLKTFLRAFPDFC